MTQADAIRQFVLKRYIQAARGRGTPSVVVRAGDVHQEMGLTNAYPAVCAALGSRKFEHLAGVTIAAVDGPASGSNVYFRFSLDGQEQTVRPSTNEAAPSTISPSQGGAARTIDLGGAVTLVSCVKSKLDAPAAARSLYVSAWFQMARDFIEAQHASWYVLSARYGLVKPHEEIAPYEHTLNEMSVHERRAWAAEVLCGLLPAVTGRRRVVILAGQRYREFLVGPLRNASLSVEIPLEGLRLGEQLAWLSGRR